MVRRILPFRQRRMVGPFIFLDHAGPVDIVPDNLSAMDVLPHPHIGLSTVTYLLGGQVTHRDSLGVEQIIRPGEVNWMTAGKGIAHSERFEDPSLLAQHSVEMLQSWVALPEEHEETDPSFQNFSPDKLPDYTDNGVWMRLIAGNAYGLTSRVKTHSPLFYLHVRLNNAAKINLPSAYPEKGVYVVAGCIEVAGYRYQQGQMLVFDRHEDPIITAIQPATLMLLGGEPLGKRYIWWNFVSSRKERIDQAKEDWKAGRILLPPNDNTSFIPLPAGNSKPSEPPEAPLLS